MGESSSEGRMLQIAIFFSFIIQIIFLYKMQLLKHLKLS